MDHHSYPRSYIGESDYATLILVGVSATKQEFCQELKFGEDSEYHAYIVDKDCDIPDHYHLVDEFKSWLKVYDDQELTQTFNATRIKIFRAGEMGCIIQTLD